MRVESNLLKRKEGRDLTVEKRKAPSKKSKKRQKKASTASAATPSPRAAMTATTVVQRLHDTCKEIFADCGPGIVPSADDIIRLQSFLDTMRPSDVGLSPNMPFFLSAIAERAPPVLYLHLYDCPKFSMGIFCLPQSAAIPLHNHPGMTVFSKILFGSMHIRSFDWVDSPQGAPTRNGAHLAKLNTNAVFTTPSGTSTLYPTAGGNLHRFTAISSCAVLDILGPPYDDDGGRPCTYYNEYPYTQFQGGDDTLLIGEGDEYSWLEERERQPDDFIVLGAEYRGPQIAER